MVVPMHLALSPAILFQLQFQVNRDLSTVDISPLTILDIMSEILLISNPQHPVHTSFRWQSLMDVRPLLMCEQLLLCAQQSMVALMYLRALALSTQQDLSNHPLV
jgi:hypothetical protein